MQTKVIVLVGVVPGLFLISVMAAVTRLFVNKHTKATPRKDIDISDGSFEHQTQLAHISSSWKRLFAPKPQKSKDHPVATLSSFLKAGDEGLFSSKLFSNLHGRHGDLTFSALYDAFTSESPSGPFTERSLYSGELSRSSSWGLRRTKSVSHKVAGGGRRDMRTRSPTKSLDLSAAERGLAGGTAMRRQSSILVATLSGMQGDGSGRPTRRSWTNDGQNERIHVREGGFKVTAADLAALSIILGSPLENGGEQENGRSQMGAYAISINISSRADHIRRVTLQQHDRTISQQYAQGTGSSLLFMKHMATGSLPFSQDKKTVQTILITVETLNAIKTGALLSAQPSTSRTPQADLLASLPSSREPKFHDLAQQTTSTTSHLFTDAIAALPFVGGLTPLASTPLIGTVQFIACGGLPPARLLQRLEALVDKVNQLSPKLNLFGPLHQRHNGGLLIRERARLSRLATDISTPDSLTDKTARMSRYTTLLERLMALVPDMKAQDVLAAVQQATRNELERSYIAAVLAYTNKDAVPVSSRCCPESETRSKRKFMASEQRSGRSSTQSARTSDSITSPRSTFEFPSQNLGKQVEQVLKMELPLNVETIAFVARMVIVAWTLSVQNVAWDEGESGFRVPSLEELGDNIVLC